MENELIPLVAARFKALSDPHRLAILSRLKDGECTVGGLAEATNRPQPNVSQHLSSLSHAGLVESRRDGTRVYYRIADVYILKICEAVCDSLAEGGAARRRHGAALRSRRRAGGRR